MVQFINLHHHDNFSLRCSLGDVTDVIKKAKEFNQNTFAITNYNQLSGWVKQYFSCKEAKMKTIFAVQMMISNYRVFLKQNSKLIDHIDFCGANRHMSLNVQDMTEQQKVAVGVNWHLLLYAKNEIGYYNIIKIHNQAQLQGVYEHPRSTNEFLSTHGEGVVCVIPSVNGQVINDIENDRQHFAIVKYNSYKKIFEDVYLQLTIAQDDYYIEENNKVIQFANKYDIPLVISINSHYINPQDEQSLKALMSIKKGGDVRKEVNICPNMSYKNTEQVYELFHKKFENDIFTLNEFEKALNNNIKLADSIEDFQVNTDIKMPKYPNAAEVLKEKAWEGLRNRGKADDPIYKQRLEYELDNVIKAGFADYFLFLYDVCKFCHNNNINTGFGRGSGGGCIVLYALYIFDVDPVKYNLLFQRFLDANRLHQIVSQGGKVTGCFPLDTFVKTKDGYTEIGKIQIGDSVVTKNGEIKKVTNIFDYNVDFIIRIVYENWYFDCTPYHKILTIRNKQKLYVHAHQLNIGDVLVQFGDKPVRIKYIGKSHSNIDKVRDIEIQDNHNYIICGKPINEVLLKNNEVLFLNDKELKEILD